MESAHFDRHDAAFAREALDTIAVDRRRLAARFTAAIAIAIALVGIEHRFRKRTGISTNRPAGPASLAVLIVLCAMIVAAFVISLVLATVGERSWIIASTSAGFLVMLGGVALYDRAYARDLRRAR